MMSKPVVFIASTALAILGMTVGAMAAVTGSSNYTGALDSWDYVYDGASDAFGANAGGFDSLDGTWAHASADDWDGSAPGNDVAVPGPPVPGGAESRGSGPDYLTIQDAGKPSDYGYAKNNGGRNKKLYWGHDITADAGNVGALSVMDNGMTLTFRARVSGPNSGALSQLFPEAAPAGFPSAWPAGGKGYAVSSDARGMFGVEQNGAQALGFSLALSDEANNTYDPNSVPLYSGGGLVMSNQPGAVNAGGSESAGFENRVAISDANLLDWNEFYITVKDNADGSAWRVSVWMNGNVSAPDGVFFTKKQAASEYLGQTLVMGVSSGSNYGAFDTDFFAYKLGAVPAPEPSSIVLGLLAFAGLALVGRRRRS